MADDLKTLEAWIKESKSVVFFGGAGVSTQSGVPDFRSETGLYKQKFDYPPERVLSRSFFVRKTKAFYDFYRDNLLFPNAKPNAAHIALARMEDKGYLSCVITQNIDGLHQAAGSKKVYELHGSVHRNHCIQCKKRYDLSRILESKDIPYCSCGGIIKPDVILFQEPLSQRVMDAAINSLMAADLLIIGGTSLSVYPAASLIDAYGGKRIVVCNQSPTPLDEDAALVFRAPIADVLKKLDL